MVNIEPTTTPGALFDPSELLSYLRMPDMGESSQLTEFIAAAVERFEDETRRPVLATTYRQYFKRWPRPMNVGTGYPGAMTFADGYSGPISFAEGYPLALILGRGGVTSVAGVYRYLVDGSTAAIAYTADLKTVPVRCILTALPQILPVSPVGYIEFTAGWANAGAVPKTVKVAIKSLAAHWYRNPEAFSEKALVGIEQGWKRVVDQHRLGLMGDWGQ